LIQLAIVGAILWLVMRMFRRRPAYGSPFMAAEPDYPGAQPFGAQSFGGASFGGPWGGASGPAAAAPPPTGPAWEIPITAADQAEFERLLTEVQDAYAREDYGALRERVSPEVMGY